MRWLRPGSYSAAILLLFLGIISVIFTWTSVGLVGLAMANAEYLRKFGIMAAVDGGLLQLLEISGKGFVCLLCLVGFKGIEYELIARWRGDTDH